ncbi:MAG: 50S ribosomal protein L20 [Firmicutes bacterium]|nr:50S ribosomal protein L20 [Bacillota bacterium]
MPRVKRGVTKRKRHQKILRLAKGYWGAKSKQFRIANQAVMKSLVYAYRDRRVRRRDFRRLWISRINAAARASGISYSRLISGLRKAEVAVNRKILADLAISDADAFKKLVEVAKSRL